MKNIEQITQNKSNRDDSSQDTSSQDKSALDTFSRDESVQTSSVCLLSHSLSPSFVPALFTWALSILFFLLSSLASAPVFASADDDISNTATISFVISGVANSQQASSSFKEDRLINFTVMKLNDGGYDSVIENLTNAVMAFTVLNNGNDVQDFLLAASNTSLNPFTSEADDFNALTPMRVFAESGTTPGYQVAEDSEFFIDELAPKTSTVVYVLADMPAGINPGEVAAVALHVQVAEGGVANSEGSAITNDDNGKISPASPASGYSNGNTMVVAGSVMDNINTLGLETVFNDPAGAQPEDVDSSLNQDAARNGQHSDAGAFQVVPPVVIVNSVTVIDTDGNAEPRPSSTLRYQLDVSVNGSVSVENLIVKNPIPANTTYTDGTITLDGVDQTDIVDTATDFSRAIDISSKPVTSIEVDLSQGGTVSVLPGTTHVITFDVTIN